MARSPFETAGAFDRNVSDTPTPAGSIPTSRAVERLAGATRELGQRLQGLADVAEGRAGQEEAARDVAAGRLVIRGGLGVRDRVYDAAAREHLSAGLRAEYLSGVGEAEIANPDNPAGYAEAEAALWAAFESRFAPADGSAMDPAIRLDLEQFRTVQNGAALLRVRRAEEATRIDIGQAAMLSSLQTETTAFGQVVAGAALDETGSATVSVAYERLVTALARYGPREGFAIGGVTFAPDPTRLEVVGAPEIARAALQAGVEGRTSWILNNQARLSGAAAQAEFAGQMRERWAAGDPIFAGLDASTADQLFARLEGQADRTSADERAERLEAAQRATNFIEALRYGGEVDPGELRAAAAESGDPGLVAQANYALTVGVTPPGGGGGGGRYAGDVSLQGGFEAWAGFFFNWETGGGRTEQVVDINGRISRFGINEAAHPNARTLTQAGASEILRRDYWGAIGADRLPPALAFVAADAAAVAGPGRARAWIEESHGDVGRFLDLQERHYRRLAEQDPGQYGPSLAGWLERLGDARLVATRLDSAAVSRQGMATDPIAFAMGNSSRPALMGVPTLNINGWRSPETAGDFARALIGRRAAGGTLAERYGAPVRLLTNGERQALSQTFEQEPMAAVAFAQVAISSLGHDEAGSLMREIGADGIAPALGLYLADLRTQESGAASPFVAMAIRGVELRQEGMRPPSLPEGESWEDAFAPYQSAFRNQPRRLQGARLAAEAAYWADAASGVQRPLSFYVNSALGSVTREGRVFGGLSRVNGAQTPVPPWLARDAMPDALDEMAVWWEDTGYGPHWANGEALTASQTAAQRLVLLADGRYALVRPTGEVLLDRNGRPFSFDMDNTRDWLSQQLGAAVAPRRP